MAVILRFTAAWQDRNSPIRIRYVENMVTLRFDKPWVNRTSPLRLRFGDGPEGITVAVGVTLPLTVVT
ncbi:MAG: hypothetical protein ACRDA8_11845, partial [Shewanella sp.]